MGKEGLPRRVVFPNTLLFRIGLVLERIEARFGGKDKINIVLHPRRIIIFGAPGWIQSDEDANIYLFNNPQLKEVHPKKHQQLVVPQKSLIHQQ